MVDQFVSRPTVPTNDDDVPPGTPASTAPDATTPAGAPAAEAPRAAPAPAAEPAPAPAPAEAEWNDGGSPLRAIVTIAGVVLLVAGVAAWLFTRSRRRPSRRDRATAALRDAGVAAGAIAGSLGGVAALRGRLDAALPSRKQLERRARRAAKVAKAARRAR